MATPIDYSKLLLDPAFQDALANTPMQPQLQDMFGSASMSMTELPQSEKEVQKMIRDKFMQSQAQQEQQLKMQQQMLAQELKRQSEMGVLGNLDLRPFAQAAKQYGATTAVVPAEAPMDRSEMVQKLQEQIQRGQRGLTQDQIGFLRTMMEEKRAGQLGLSQGNQDIRVFQDVKKAFAKPADDLNSFYQSHDVVKAALDSGDITAIQSALSNYARMSGEKGVLTDQDIIRVMPSNLKTKAAKWWAAVSSDPTIQAPPEVVTALAAGLERLKTAAETKTKSAFELVKSEAEQGPGTYPRYAKTLYLQAIKAIRPHEMTEKEKIMQELKALKENK